MVLNQTLDNRDSLLDPWSTGQNYKHKKKVETHVTEIFIARPPNISLITLSIEKTSAAYMSIARKDNGCVC